MIRFVTSVLLIGLAGAASAQVANTTSSATSLAAETRVQDEAFAAWKVRYATNRAKVAQEIKAVQQEISTINPAKAVLRQQLTDLLTGTVKQWNVEKADYADPNQFAGCQALFGTIRQAIRDGVFKL